MISLFMKICIFTVFGIVLALFLLFASRQFRPTSTAQLFDDCDKTVDSKMDLEEARSTGDDNNENLVGFPIMISPPDPDISETFITLADSIHKYTIKMPNDNDMNMDHHDPKAKPQADKKSTIFAALSDSLHKYSLHKSNNTDKEQQTVEKEKDCENASDAPLE